MKILYALILLIAIFSFAFSSPGDSVGMTALDFQRSGSFGQRIFVDDLHQVHIYWMKCPYPFYGTSQRRMQLNYRYADGTYHGEIDASPFTTGYGTMDVTRDSNPALQRTVICYHYNTGTNAYYPHIDIDSGNLWGSFPNNPRHPPNTNNMLWPCVACTNNGNIVMATDDNAGDFQHLFVTTDQGLTWTNTENFDSVAVHSHFVRASTKRGSNKVVFVNTKFLQDTAAAGQYDNDVYYMLSMDGGVAWGSRVNITHYQPQDSIRAFWGTHANFDLSDDLHIVWAGRHIVNGHYLDASKIFHWDQVSNTITVVSGPNPLFPGGWWGWTSSNEYGFYRLPADEPQLVTDRTTGWLYCLWHGQTDTTDYSLAGHANGDFFGSFSTDGGLSWDAYGSAYGYVNLTNTHTPGAPRWQCEDEDYMTANPFTVDDSIFITYIEDKDAGICVDTEGDTTDNPVRMWVFHKSLISGPANVEEAKVEKPAISDIGVYPNPFRKTTTFSIGYSVTKLGGQEGRGIQIYNISGRLIKELDSDAIWRGDDLDGNALPAGVYIYRYADGNKVLTGKIVKL